MSERSESHASAGSPLASAELLRRAKKFARLSNQAQTAELEFMELAKTEFPDLEDDNDAIAENLTYGGFENDRQTRKRLTEILRGSY